MGSCPTGRETRGPVVETGFEKTADGLLAQLEQESLQMEPPLPLGSYAPELLSRRIIDSDVRALADGISMGVVFWRGAGRFDTLDRPVEPRGRWWLIEKDGGTRRPCWEFVPQLAAYVELIRDLGYHRHRVLFDTPQDALQLDIAVLDDANKVVILGEAKKESKDLDRLENGLFKHLDEAPDPKRGDEPRQLAWRLWTSRAPYLWLIGPADRRAFQVTYEPLRITPIETVPHATELGLDQGPESMMPPARLI